ncbi:hypothetical protein EDB40_101241 [Vibrio crassostreae]|nr:hypothetical protein EDB40_101241 [Vibrio crassostreae]
MKKYKHLAQRATDKVPFKDKMYPVEQWECERATRITALQGNTNRVVQSRCKNRT